MAVWGADARYTRLVEQHGSGLFHLTILFTGKRAVANRATDIRFHAHLDDKSFGEVMGISAATVRSHAHPGLTKLREAHAARTLTEEQS